MRLTAQVAEKHRLTANFESQQRCDGTPLKAETDGCHTRGSNWVAATAASSPEAALNYLDVPYTVVQGRWTNPMTTRVLLEAGATYYSYRHAGGFLSLPPDGIFDIRVTEASTALNPATGQQYAPRSNYVYRALSEYRDDTASPNNWNADITWETDFGPARTSYWQGVDFTVNARTRQGLTLQLGTNTGRKIDDTCATVVKIDSPDPRNCRLTPPHQTTIRGLASYTIPRVDVLVSAAIRSQPPVARTATWPVPNSLVVQILGRIPPGGTTNIALIDNEHQLYADNRRTQVDLRVAKIFRFGTRRLNFTVRF